MRDYSEKRNFIRMKVDAPIELRRTADENEDAERIQGICRNLSGTGMEILVDEEIAPGTELYSTMPSNNPSFPSFETRISVLRAHPHEDKYILGVEITEVAS
ncbi:PilZ domain-containing protein [Allohahella marinimesophila]|uniref:Cyclic di-GMP-binding protein PilZ n=1 Tax=Allohahella marinimesophila TaxID=1054972 RepID=A0ABP7NQA5_9GAMM